MEPEEPAAYQFGEFVLDVESRKLIKSDGEEIELSKQRFNLLIFLLEKKGKPVDNDAIFKRIWAAEKFVSEGRLNQLISALRNNLDDKDEKEIIKNRSGIGYCLGIESKELTLSELEAFLERIKFQKKEFPNPSSTETENQSGIPAVEAEIPPEIVSGPAEQSAPSVSTDDTEKKEPPKPLVAGKNPNKPLEKPPAFGKWLAKSGVKWWFIVIAAATVLISILKKDSNFAALSGSLSHLLVVVIALAYYYFSLQVKVFRSFTDDLETKDSLLPEVAEATKHKSVNEWFDTRKDAENVFATFTTYWVILLLIWLALYGLLAFLSYLNLIPIYKENVSPEWNQYLKQILTVTNNFNTLMLILCFLAFNRLEKIRQDDKWYFKEKKWLFGIVLIVVLALAEGGCLYEYQRIGSLLDKKDLRKEDILWFFRVVSGLTGAVAMSLFVGRLQSKFFNPPSALIAALYSYTAIQPLFVFFDDDSKSMPFITALVIHTALILKCVLFLYLFWAFETGRLLFYLVRVRLTNHEIEEEWQKFQLVFKKTPRKSIP